MILNEADLVRWGGEIGREVIAPVVIALRGPLGAGKSVLARAVARGVGIEGPIPSPTFNLLFRYEGPSAAVVHMDLYRIRQPSELDELGWDELLGAGEIVLIEWPERAGDRLPADRWDIELRPTDGVSGLREVFVRRVGAPPGLPSFPIALTPGGR